jgi:hypothetical protein
LKKYAHAHKIAAVNQLSASSNSRTERQIIMSNADLQFKNSNDDTSAEVRRTALHEMEARDQMVAARREQQRLSILRSLNCSRR